MSSSAIIEYITTKDVRFRNGPGAGTDSVHTTGIYGYSICLLYTNHKQYTGWGLAFTLGGGNDSICRLIEEITQEILIGKDIENIMANWNSIWIKMCEHPQLRWLGPHKGAVHLALAAITNSCFDLWAKVRQKPLWQLLLSLSSQEIINLLDFRYVKDILSKDEAIRILEECRATRHERDNIIQAGYPGYDTSFGWMGYSDKELEIKVKEAMKQGFKAVKLKVGSVNIDDDIRRIRHIRKIIGSDIYLMLDVNQQWSLDTVIQLSSLFKDLNIFWLEEPTHPDDIISHRTMMDHGIPIAIGEAIPNVVIFKNYMQLSAAQYIQVDPTRTGGISETLLVSLLSHKYHLGVCPHIGCMGQISQHLVIFNHIALNIPKLFLEYIPHLKDCFVNPAKVINGVYITPNQPGCSSDLIEQIKDYSTNGYYDTIIKQHIQK